MLKSVGYYVAKGHVVSDFFLNHPYVIGEDIMLLERLFYTLPAHNV
jgi:hypothetical protein